MKRLIDISEDEYRKVQDGRASVSMMRKVIKKGEPVDEFTAYWVDKNVRGSITPYCTACGNGLDLLYHYKYCPNCGAKMIEPQENEDEELDFVQPHKKIKVNLI